MFSDLLIPLTHIHVSSYTCVHRTTNLRILPGHDCPPQMLLQGTGLPWKEQVLLRDQEEKEEAKGVKGIAMKRKTLVSIVIDRVGANLEKSDMQQPGQHQTRKTE